MAQANWGILAKSILQDKAKEILYFPFWWYGKGLVKATKILWQKIKDTEARLGLKIWVTNLFTPMFGQRDIAGVAISFFMRVVQIIGRFFILLIWAILMAGLLFLWLVLPIFVVLAILINLVA
jgi:hypothetical protein